MVPYISKTLYIRTKSTCILDVLDLACARTVILMNWSEQNKKLNQWEN